MYFLMKCIIPNDKLAKYRINLVQRAFKLNCIISHAKYSFKLWQFVSWRHYSGPAATTEWFISSLFFQSNKYYNLNWRVGLNQAVKLENLDFLLCSIFTKPPSCSNFILFHPFKLEELFWNIEYQLAKFQKYFRLTQHSGRDMISNKLVEVSVMRWSLLHQF